MKRTVSRFTRAFLSLVVTLLVLCAIFVGVARELVYDIGEFQPRILTFVNEQSGLQLELESLSGSWKGLAPRFTLRNVSLRMADSDGEPLHVDTIDLEILLLKSLLSLQPRVRLHVDGARGQAFYRDQHLVLSGFESFENQPAAEPTQSDDSALDILLAQPRLSFTNSELEITGLYDEPVSMVVHQFQTEAGARRRYLLGDFTAQGPSNIHFSLKGRINGSVFRKGTLNGGMYVHVDTADWFPWIPAQQRALPQATLDSLNGGASFWLNFSKGKLEEILSDFTVDDIALTSENDIKPPHILNLQGKARWAEQSTGGWRLDLQDIKMQTTRFLWMPQVVRVVADAQSENTTRYRIIVDDVDIEPWVNYYLGTQSAEAPVHQILSKLRPSGKLQDVALELLVSDEQVKDYHFALKLTGFQNRPWKFYPGFHDLEVQAWGKKGKTLFRVDEDYLELNYPRMFRDVLTINHVDANLELRETEDQWLLQSSPIHAHTHHARSATQLSLAIPKDKEQPPFLQLQATLRDADGKFKSLYLPSGVIPDSLLKWLDEAIIDGHLLRGDILVHGPVRRDQAEPLGVLLGFTAADGVLQFQPDWKEPVRNGLADVIVDRGEVDARIVEATYYDQSLLRGSVTLPHYNEGTPHVLSVRAETTGAAEQGVRILKESPLRQSIGELIDDVLLQGNLAVDFSLDIPLQSEFKQQTRSLTKVQVTQGKAALQSQNIYIEALSAQVEFDLQKGLSSRQMAGRFLGGAVKGTIQTRRQADVNTTVLALAGKTTINAVNQWRPLSVLQPLSGPLNYRALISIPYGSQKTTAPKPQLEIRSDLIGVNVQLPEPFGKTSEGPMPFSFTMGLGVSPLQLAIQYGDLLNLKTLSDDQGVKKIALHFGLGNAQLPDSDQIRVSGILPRFNDAEWKPVFDRIQTRAQKNEENTDPTLLYRLDDSTLRVGDLTLAGNRFGQTDLRLRRGNQAWDIWLNNEMATGKVTMPDYILGSPDTFHGQSRPILVDLERLHIAKDESPKDEESAPAPWQPADISPKVFPPVDVTLGQFTVGDANFGQWSIKARPASDGLDIPDFNALVNGVTLSGNARWTEAEDGARSTRVRAELKANNAADVIKAMGGAPSLSSKHAEAGGQLVWPGAPFEFALVRAQGDVTVNLQSGVFYNVNSNAAGKLWGALNFETLMRRLQLDFDDIRESEMVYDELSGNINLDLGVLNLSQVKLNSPAIKMQAAGKVDVEHSALDLGLDVALPVTRNLVLPAAVIGGVPAAATAYVVEKMFGEQFDKLTTIKYKIEGTFDQPVVTVKDSFSFIPKQVGEAVINKEKPAAQPANEDTP